VLALVWNVRDLSDTIQQRVDELLRPVRRDTPSEHEQPWRDALRASALYRPAEERSFPWAEPQTTAELLARVASISFVASLEEDERQRLLARVAEAVDGLPQPFDFRYRTDVLVFARA
jgi:hypothetical protein